MTEINKIESKFLNFHKGSDYLISDNGRGEKSYTIRSEELKQSLRDIVHSTREWRIEYVAGQRGIEFTMERNNSFGLYWKNLDVNSPDEFTVLDTSNKSRDTSSSIERRRKEYLQSGRKIEESTRRVEESTRRLERPLLEQPEINSESRDYVSFNIQKGEGGEWVKGMNSENCPNSTIKDLLSKWEDEGLFQNKGGEIPRQQTQQKIKDNREDAEKNFTQHHQIPPKK